LVSCIV